MYRITCIGLATCACGFAAVTIAGARAEDVALASLRLRGGYDANPTLSAQGRGTGLIGADLAFALGTENDDVKAGIVGEASATRYADPSILPGHHEKLKLELANKEQAGLSVRSTTSLDQTKRYDLRAFDARQSVRAQWVGGPIRPFTPLRASSALLPPAQYGGTRPTGRFSRIWIIPRWPAFPQDSGWPRSVSRPMMSPWLWGRTER